MQFAGFSGFVDESRDRDTAEGPGGLAGRIQEPPNRALDFLILALTCVTEHDGAALVDDILGWPVLIAPRVPGSGIIVLRHGIRDSMARQRSLHIAGRPFEGKFWSMDTDHNEPATLVLLVELRHIGQRVNAVVATVGPEIDQHHPAPQLAHCEGRRIEPPGDADEVRGGCTGFGQLKGLTAIAGNNRRRYSRGSKTGDDGEKGSA